MWNKKQVIEKLRENGNRITKQRRIILDVIFDGQWGSCKDICYEALKRDPKIGVATVYRMVNMLEDLGVLTREKACMLVKKEEEEVWQQ
ncbi:MAG TPA: transcriptional repressor [Candidatus Limivivens merdigallinarum]|uniref:Transcriptional repressor n=1 Tax=Candidatus Limivivens merdigallinarum TaxID=2840859 RepID=A0A9D1CZ59_9FIRM|nr:transcriptional repressor [Candidatus Limivivens merdigallinarum]